MGAYRSPYQIEQVGCSSYIYNGIRYNTSDFGTPANTLNFNHNSNYNLPTSIVTEFNTLVNQGPIAHFIQNACATNPQRSEGWGTYIIFQTIPSVAAKLQFVGLQSYRPGSYFTQDLVEIEIPLLNDFTLISAAGGLTLKCGCALDSPAT